jgi:hypothetical protein
MNSVWDPPGVLAIAGVERPEIDTLIVLDLEIVVHRPHLDGVVAPFAVGGAGPAL